MEVCEDDGWKCVRMMGGMCVRMMGGMCEDDGSV